MLGRFRMVKLGARVSGGSTPWQTGHDAAKNPVARLQAAADVANAMDPARIPELQKLLQADDAAERWWGAIGLVALGAKAAPARKAALAALRDDSPIVRVAGSTSIRV